MTHDKDKFDHGGGSVDVHGTENSKIISFIEKPLT
jgi:hypothetical protein